MSKHFQSSNDSPHTIVGLGELLWDVLPAGKQLGGAPTNFAYVARLLGNQAFVASRIGDDEHGHEALNRLEQLGLSTLYVQRDEKYSTGIVRVEIDAQGEASYTNSQDDAWDHLEYTPQWKELAMRADAVCFGTLAQRSTESRLTIQKFLQAMRPDALRIFDVNLRHSFVTAEMLSQSLEAANVVKLNSDELPRVSAMLELGGRGSYAFANRLLQVFDLDLVAITRGADGSLLVAAEDMVEHPGFRVPVADTIGAGDAFAAALAHNYLQGASLEQISESANRTGAWIATQTGATPFIVSSEFESAIMRTLE
ncbi:MAG: PfkB family carbohydrate kinase [Pyrinomonadaceae bacterium]